MFKIKLRLYFEQKNEGYLMAKGSGKNDTRKKYYFSIKSLKSRRFFHKNMNIEFGNNNKRKLPGMEDIKILLLLYKFRRKEIFSFY